MFSSIIHEKLINNNNNNNLFLAAYIFIQDLFLPQGHILMTSY